MAQREVYNFLARHKGTWFSSNEIAEMLQMRATRVQRGLRRLREAKQISFQEIERINGYSLRFKYMVE